LIFKNQPGAQLPLSELSSLMATRLSERGELSFDLAEDLLYIIVIPVDFMAFQTKDIRNASRTWRSSRLGTPSMPFAFIGLCRIGRQASFSLP
jgi:hypothetical protein